MNIYFYTIVLVFELLHFNSAGVLDKHDDEKITGEHASATEARVISAKTRTDFDSLGDFNLCDRTTADGKKWNFKISSWNVGGLRACVGKGLVDYLKYEDADIYCIQQTRCPNNLWPAEANISGYHLYTLGGDKHAFAGVALYSKVKPIKVTCGIGDEEYDEEGRVLLAEYEKFYVFSAYFMSSGSFLSNIVKRMQFDIAFRRVLNNLNKKKPVILAGDLNVAATSNDLINPDGNFRSAGFTREERLGFTKIQESGFVDVFRNLYPEKQAFTYWHYRKNARGLNRGWRFDYFLVSERLMPSVCDQVFRNEIFGSDHCPITLFLHV